MILQWAETQIDSAHSTQFEGGKLHGHTWFIRAARDIGGYPEIPDVGDFFTQLLGVTTRFDHRCLHKDESLAEQLAKAIGELLDADEVEVWRFVRGGKVGASWRA